MYWLSYSSHTSHHPSQTPCLPWISYATQKLMLDSCKMVEKQSEGMIFSILLFLLLDCFLHTSFFIYLLIHHFSNWLKMISFILKVLFSFPFFLFAYSKKQFSRSLFIPLPPPPPPKLLHHHHHFISFLYTQPHSSLLEVGVLFFFIITMVPGLFNIIFLFLINLLFWCFCLSPNFY